MTEFSFIPRRVPFHVLIERAAKDHRLEKQRRPLLTEVVIEAQENSGDEDVFGNLGAGYYPRLVCYLHPCGPFEQVFDSLRLVSLQDVLVAHLLIATGARLTAT